MRRVAASLAVVALLVTGCAHQGSSSDASASKPAGAGRRGGEPTLGMQSLRELLQRADASPKTFSIRTAPSSEFRPRVVTASFWKQLRGPIPTATVRTDGDRRWVEPAAIDPRANALLEQAEPAYQARRYAEAAKLAEEATRIDPKSHFAWLYFGDCAYFSGDFEAALQRYDRALALNDDDYQVHFYRGNALFRLGRNAEGRQSFARALAAKPRHEVLVDRIIGDESLDFTIRPDLIVPKVRVEATANGADIVLSEGHLEWMGFGICKALWLADGDYRFARTGSDSHGVTSVEERECLAALLTGYENRRDEKDFKPDPALEYLRAVVEDGATTELLFYEVFSRVDPQITLTFPDELREKLVAYIEEHVFVPRPPLPKDPPRGGDGAIHGAIHGAIPRPTG